jgi:hypothetical protein
VIEDRVYALVSEQTGTDRTKLCPDSTLSHDLGIEGDDAVEFFEHFGQEFGIDMTQLGVDWHRYFSPEGIGLGTLVIAGVPALLGAFYVNLKFPRLGLLTIILMFVVWWLILYCWTRLRGPRGSQISIQDLIDCVRVGKWTKMLPAEPVTASNRPGGKSL